ncbi:hypothetical protein [Endozoicomonas sp. ONNA2]|uniref:hypothetical protein n=1 Tax=Endozoicomonas sp. ONNA2 TaxID=2828741 RepID=UPI002148EDEE|nr:hypothetical protein [Endozoicomonas sp. ONNA2]
MAWFVDQWVERKACLSHIEHDLCGFIPKSQLEARAKANASRKAIGLRGKKHPEHETRYYSKMPGLWLKLPKKGQHSVMIR